MFKSGVSEDCRFFSDSSCLSQDSLSSTFFLYFLRYGPQSCSKRLQISQLKWSPVVSIRNWKPTCIVYFYYFQSNKGGKLTANNCESYALISRGGTGGFRVSRFPYYVLPPPVRLCPFASLPSLCCFRLQVNQEDQKPGFNFQTVPKLNILVHYLAFNKSNV